MLGGARQTDELSHGTAVLLGSQVTLCPQAKSGKGTKTVCEMQGS